MNISLLEWLITPLIIVGLLFLCTVVPYALWHGDKRDSALMVECMKDHKEYECVSMLHRSSSAVPIIIPVSR